MPLSPDAIIYWQWGPVTLNATIVFTWVVMVVLVGGAAMATRTLSSGAAISGPQNILETVVTFVSNEIEGIMGRKPEPYIPFIGTLLLFVGVANLLSIVPGYRAPTGSLSTTAALAICVFVAIPFFGISQNGIRKYFQQYIQPSVFMLPFNIIGELSRTMAMAVRLFGNIMSGDLLVAILLAIVPLFFPIIMQLLGLLIGVIQAYIFAILATVYISSAVQVKEDDR